MSYLIVSSEIYEISIENVNHFQNHIISIHRRERKEKNAIALQNVEISQNEEQLKQQLKSESHEVNKMCETIQKLTDERNDLEMHLNECQQQIESIEDLKNEISDKNKVVCLEVACLPEVVISRICIFSVF